MSIWNRLKTSWRPNPIHPPQVDPDLHHLDGLTRSVESIRYSILSIEFWMSPNGQVREWLRHNAHLAVWVGIPAIIVVPIITFILCQIVKWTTILTSIARHLIILPTLGLLVVVVLLLVVGLVKAILR
jgi:hypothetical protein